MKPAEAEKDDIQPQTFPGMPDVDDALFRTLFRKCKPFSLLTMEKFYNLYTATHYLCNRQVQGDIIECGVWKGGASLMISECSRIAASSTTIFIFTTPSRALSKEATTM
jgi:hypothetical protein